MQYVFFFFFAWEIIASSMRVWADFNTIQFQEFVGKIDPWLFLFEEILDDGWFFNDFCY